MMRFGAVCVAILGLTAGVAHADIGMLPGGATITWERLFIRDNEGTLTEPPEPDDQRRYFNLAHCQCSQSNAGPQTTFQYELKLSMETNLGRPLDVWVGTDCENDQVRPTMCRQLTDKTISDIDNLFDTERLELSTYDVINGIDNVGPCVQREGSAIVWLLGDTDGNAAYDFSSTKSVGADMANNISGFDTQPPPLPVNFTVAPGEESVVISWDPPEGREDDVYYYQALCMDADGNPIRSEPPEPQYQTTATVCELPAMFDLMATPIDSVDGDDVPAPPAAFSNLDPAFICEDEAAGTATSLTIKDLVNDQPYTIALVVIDQYGNPVGTYFNRTVVPKPVTDFWEDLHDRGSEVNGGCLLSETYGETSSLTRTLRSFRDHTLADTILGRALIDAYYATLGKLTVADSLALRVVAAVVLAPLVVIALLWHALTLPGLIALIALPLLWRRRRRLAVLRLAPVAGVLALALPSLARADDFTPYWEDATDEASYEEAGLVKWHVGIRLGPYIPEIDLQQGLNALTGLGPYEAMFGDYYLDGEKHDRRVWQVLPVLDVDRILWRGFGQLGVGGSIGYMQKTAYAYENGTSEDDLMRPRTKAAENTFRLLPLAATVTYRFTWFDEMYGIPVVPYVRGGLSYYAWWTKAPNGNLSRVCKDPMATEPCDYNKGRGGSLGYQGSIGIAIRAERIDADAAMSMRNSGIEHAGFYGEYQYAKVDGFGSETKLSVGDNTWFAGVNFEF